jgi:dihydrofolate reductase
MIRIDSFSISLDGFGAGPDQSLDAPMGQGGMALHSWVFPTPTFRRMLGQEGGSDGTDARFAEAAMAGLGAWILGRNMFGPVRGPWPDEDWRGWWGDEPPYRCPVYVLTHHPRPALRMAGGTVFHFVTGGLAEALDLARAAAGDRDVRIGGGVATIRAAFRERAIDRAHFAVSPVLLGRGEAVFAGLDLPALGYGVAQVTPGEGATHVVIERTGS